MSSKPPKKLVSRCPFCEGRLEISRLCCLQCDTSIDTKLPIPAMLQLPGDLQEFVLIFLRCQGKIRDVEKELGISYPTVIKRLELVNVLLGNAPLEKNGETPAEPEVPLEPPPVRQVTRYSRKEILEQLERGELTVQQATQLLKSN
jgi:hypothetical protein